MAIDLNKSETCESCGNHRPHMISGNRLPCANPDCVYGTRDEWRRSVDMAVDQVRHDMTLADVQRWKDEGAELRRRLKTERAQLRARLAEIDATLPRLPGGGAPPGASALAHVRDVLERAERPLAVAEVRAQLAGVGALAIGNALHRLVRRGAAVAEGPKSQHRYRIARRTAPASTGGKVTTASSPKSPADPGRGAGPDSKASESQASAPTASTV